MSIEARALMTLVLVACTAWSPSPLLTLGLIVLAALTGLGDLLPVPARVRGLIRLVEARVFVYRLRRARKVRA